MPPRRCIRAALGLSLLLAGSACTDSQPPPTRGGSIRVEGEEPGSLDPVHADDPSETRIVRNLFRGLVRFDERRGSLQGASASKWEISSDAVTFVFYLRQDNKF
jgi:ABC-type oligopeptide transport system substrate-binding subunit